MLTASKHGRAQGYATVTDPEKGLVERDTFTCGHCQRIVFVQPGTHSSGDVTMCWQCATPVCQRCVAKQECTPFMRKLEAQEAQDRIRRSYE